MAPVREACFAPLHADVIFDPPYDADGCLPAAPAPVSDADADAAATVQSTVFRASLESQAQLAQVLDTVAVAPLQYAPPAPTGTDAWLTPTPTTYLSAAPLEALAQRLDVQARDRLARLRGHAQYLVFWVLRCLSKDGPGAAQGQLLMPSTLSLHGLVAGWLDNMRALLEHLRTAPAMPAGTAALLHSSAGVGAVVGEADEATQVLSLCYSTVMSLLQRVLARARHPHAHGSSAVVSEGERAVVYVNLVSQLRRALQQEPGDLCAARLASLGAALQVQVHSATQSQVLLLLEQCRLFKPASLAGGWAAAYKSYTAKLTAHLDRAGAGDAAESEMPRPPAALESQPGMGAAAVRKVLADFAAELYIAAHHGSPPALATTLLDRVDQVDLRARCVAAARKALVGQYRALLEALGDPAAGYPPETLSAALKPDEVALALGVDLGSGS
jgi:hypothetical protein